MRCLSYFFTFFLLFHFVFHGSLFAQNSDLKINYNQLYESIRTEYGLNQEFVNGIYYENYYLGSLGHPYLFDDQYYNGDIIYRNKIYKDVLMKYDIFKQQIIIYYSYDNSNLQFILPNEFISEFYLNDKSFRKCSFPGIETGFFQVIHSDSEKLKCFYYWSKQRYNSYHNKDYGSYKFTDSKRKSFIMIEGSLLAYNNKNSFIKIFPKEIQLKIKKYINLNKIKVMKTDDHKMTGLIDYCAALLNNY